MSEFLVLLPVLLFMAAMLLISAFLRRAADLGRAGSSSGWLGEYFIGSRSLGGFVLAMTTVATYSSVSSFVGGPGQAWEIGFGWIYMSVVQVTMLILLLGILGKPGVEPVHIPGPAVAVCAVLIAQKAEIRIFEIVLYDGAMPGIRQLLPHGFKSGVFCHDSRILRDHYFITIRIIKTGKLKDIRCSR